MLLFDVNVLVYAFRQDIPESDRYAAWLEDVINSETAYGLSDLVLSGFIRIVTHPRILSPPATIGEALVALHDKTLITNWQSSYELYLDVHEC